jgi:transposase
MAADGVANLTIAAEVGVTPVTVRDWRSRFAAEGLAKFAQVRRGRGRKPTVSEETVEEIVRLTLRETPPGHTHWSTRTMAARVGVSRDTVQRIWDARGLKPHRVETFKLSNDPDFEEKLVDVVGLYMNPPENAIVLSIDEKSQIQALDRTQPSLPIKPGRAGTMTHDYKRNGTTTLFAALDVLSGQVIGQCLPRHRHTEFLGFLNTIDREVPKRLKVHLILDNYATHNHPKVKAWLQRHPRFELHFTPTSSSWLNMVEIFFGQLTDKAIRRGIFHSVPDLIHAIETHLAVHNGNPQPFVWTATTGQILEKVRRGRVTLEAIAS